MRQLNILFEDDFLLAIDKPAGMVVNAAISTSGEETVEEWARENLKIPAPKNKIRESNHFRERGGIVHRLDRETSGVLLIAKNEETFERLALMFKMRQVTKKYLALVHGICDSSGLFSGSIVRINKQGKFGVAVKEQEMALAKNSLTEFKLIDTFNFNQAVLNDFWRKNFERLKPRFNLCDFSLMEVILHTGRTHQIRVHFSHANHPVVGDVLYGWRKAGKFERSWCPRQFLHAKYVEFKHPCVNELIVLESNLPSDLQMILKKYLIKK